MNNRTLRALYDDASSVDYSVVEKIIRKELGKEIHEVFSSFSREPVAAASIAQVHRATLLDGTEVAVKVQKPEIQVQIEWDLIAYRLLIKAYEYIFDLPMSFAVDYTIKHLREETDFINEARNSELCNEYLQTDPKLRHQVYVPKIFKDYSTKQVMIAEWVQGCRATDKAALKEMDLSPKKVMESVVDVFAHQIFISGFVHCDPHPGNILVRKHPSDPRKHQLVSNNPRLERKEWVRVAGPAVDKQFTLTHLNFAPIVAFGSWTIHAGIRRVQETILPLLEVTIPSRQEDYPRDLYPLGRW